MLEEKFNLDRETNVKNNIDSLGKKWQIKKQSPASNLYIAQPLPYRKDFICPEIFQGAWTSVDVLQEKISLYLKESWDKADRANERAAIAAHQKEEREAALAEVARKEAVDKSFEDKPVARAKKSKKSVPAK